MFSTNRKFKELYRKWYAGVKWINENWRSLSLRDDIKTFERNVQDPMDKMWDELPAEERKLLMPELKRI